LEKSVDALCLYRLNAVKSNAVRPPVGAHVWLWNRPLLMKSNIIRPIRLNLLLWNQSKKSNKTCLKIQTSSI